MKFAQHGNLRAHIIRVHKMGKGNDGTERVQCQHCTCNFKRLGSLNAHISRFHPDVANEENLISLVMNSNENDDVSQMPNSQAIQSAVSQNDTESGVSVPSRMVLADCVGSGKSGSIW